MMRPIFSTNLRLLFKAWRKCGAFDETIAIVLVPQPTKRYARGTTAPVVIDPDAPADNDADQSTLDQTDLCVMLVNVSPTR